MRIGAILFVVAVLAAAVLLCAGRPAQAHPPTRAIRLAPADEYFGRLKISILGIRNQLRDLGLRLAYAPDRGDDVIGAAGNVEDAMHDWERKYPGDPWLAKNVYQLTALYSHVHSGLGRRSASRSFAWLLTRYGRSSYARRARVELADTLK